MADANDATLADAVALVLAHLRGDEVAIEALLAGCEVPNLFAIATGLLTGLLSQALPGGRTELERMLTAWQAEYALRCKKVLPLQRGIAMATAQRGFLRGAGGADAVVPGATRLLNQT